MTTCWSIVAIRLPVTRLRCSDPVIVVEVLSPGNALTDLRDKLQGYFRIASIAALP